MAQNKHGLKRIHRISEKTRDNKLDKERLTEEQMNMYSAQHIYTDEIKLDIYLTSTRHLACLKNQLPENEVK